MIILGCTPLGQVGILGRRVWSAALAFHTLCCLGRAFVHAHGLRLLTFAFALASALALALVLTLALAFHSLSVVRDAHSEMRLACILTLAYVTDVLIVFPTISRCPTVPVGPNQEELLRLFWASGSLSSEARCC